MKNAIWAGWLENTKSVGSSWAIMFLRIFKVSCSFNRMRKYLFLLLVFSYLNGLSQKNSDSLLLEINKRTIEATKEITELKNTTATIQENIEKNKKTWIENNGSWVAAIFIAIITILANILINNNQRKSNKEAVVLQIKNSQEVATKQIKSSSISSFRQKWIENLRDCIAEFISVSQYIYLVAYLNNSQPNQDTIDNFKKLSFLQEKIELYLNPTKNRHLEIMRSTNIIRDLLYAKDKTPKEREQILAETSNLTKKVNEILKEEWQRIKTEIG
jgi:predicted membrane protein